MSLLRQDMLLPESSIHDFGRDLVISIQYLHSNAIIYCDLKPSNILLDENGRIKLGGFGLSRRLSDINKTSLQQLPPVSQLCTGHACCKPCTSHTLSVCLSPFLLSLQSDSTARSLAHSLSPSSSSLFCAIASQPCICYRSAPESRKLVVSHVHCSWLRPRDCAICHHGQSSQ